jgi:hypothetical protein
MMSQGAGVQYECPIIMNTATEVCKVYSKFNEDCNDRGGFEDVCKLIEMYISTCSKYCKVVQRSLMKIKLENYCGFDIAVCSQLNVHHMIDTYQIRFRGVV